MTITIPAWFLLMMGRWLDIFGYVLSWALVVVVLLTLVISIIVSCVVGISDIIGETFDGVKIPCRPWRGGFLLGLCILLALVGVTTILMFAKGTV